MKELLHNNDATQRMAGLSVLGDAARSNPIHVMRLLQFADARRREADPVRLHLLGIITKPTLMIDDEIQVVHF